MYCIVLLPILNISWAKLAEGQILKKIILYSDETVEIATSNLVEFSAQVPYS